MAREALRAREGIPRKNLSKHIGWWAEDSASEGYSVMEIGEWAKAQRLDGVVWTALPPGLKDTGGQVPDPDDIVSHVRNLPAEAYRNVEEYVRRAPRQIDTEIRRRLEKDFGWTPLASRVS
jgi:hypothetical protein